MNENNNEKEKKRPNDPALFQVEAFNKAVASRDELISGQSTTILSLKEQIGNQQETISRLMKKTSDLEEAKTAAESELAEKKN